MLRWSMLLNSVLLFVSKGLLLQCSLVKTLCLPPTDPSNVTGHLWSPTFGSRQKHPPPPIKYFFLLKYGSLVGKGRPLSKSVTSFWSRRRKTWPVGVLRDGRRDFFRSLAEEASYQTGINRRKNLIVEDYRSYRS